MTVGNPGSGTLQGWTVKPPLPSGESLTAVWNGQNTGTSGTVSVRNVSWNGTLGAGGSTTFGFTVSGGSAPPATLMCTSP
ncbi:cellulose binding domain-containing protein [Streptomyces spiralis]